MKTRCPGCSLVEVGTPTRDISPPPQPGDNQSSRAPGCHSLFRVLAAVVLLLASAGECVNDCAIEHGICVSSCAGNSTCISRCGDAYGRCVGRCR